ncbi:hypothetical protein HY522_07490 [bacterium]|nr:hypothetical protein [bacterium]
MNPKCEWCGKDGENLPEFEAGIPEGFGDPFQKVARRFPACGEACQASASQYYRRYARHVKGWFLSQVALVTAAFLAALLGGYTVFRWAMPLALVVCGVIFMAFPYANRFSRHKSGSLRTSIRRSILDARLTGAGLAILALIFLYRNLLTPALF